LSDLLAQWLADGVVPDLPPLPLALAGGDLGDCGPLLDAIQGGMRPDPRLNVSEWADEKRILSSKGSAEPGKYRTSRAPFLREIMDSLSPSNPVQRVVFMKGAQIGGSELGNNFLGFIMDCAPGPVLAVQPTVELAKRFSKQRIDQLIDATPALRAKVNPARARDSGNTMLQKDFAGGTLVLTGANSAVGLRSMPARYLFLDEVDAYVPDVDGEGDPVDLAEARTKTYSFRRKMFLVSTPTIKGRSKIEAEYIASDQRRFFVPCPHCGHMQWLKFHNLRWEKGKPATATYHCEECGAGATEAHKTAMFAAGEWRATAEADDPLVRGYHVSSLYAPVGWMSWEDIARQWEKIQKSEGSKASALKTFHNTTLGETWTDAGEAPEWERLLERREDYPMLEVPAGAVVLTVGGDAQGDRLEVSLWAWGAGYERWLVDHRIIPGSPRDAGPWDEVRKLMDTDFPVAGGGTMRPAMGCFDTGGQDTAAIYGHIRRLADKRIVGIKGVQGWNKAAPVAGPTKVDARLDGRKIKGGLGIYTVAVSTFKIELYRSLYLKREGEAFPPGWVHLPQGVDAEFVKQLASEELRTVKDKRGFVRQEWAKLRERNEALDCAVYARAALWLAGADRQGARFWDRQIVALDVKRAAPEPVPVPEVVMPSPPVQRPPAPRPRWQARGSW
jgi:phage terminase large subunit GpA-like protein